MEPKGMFNLTLHKNGKLTKLLFYSKQYDPVTDLTEFQMLANAELTKLIQSHGETIEETFCEDPDEENSDEDTSVVGATPKKRKT